LLDVRNLTVDLPTAAGWIRPVNDISFQLAPAESLGLVGESGSGKTMLALALMGLLPPGARVAGAALLARGDAKERDLAQLNEKAWRGVAVFAGLNVRRPSRRCAALLRATLRATCWYKVYEAPSGAHPSPHLS
jgi:ABC-type glutathione transport system ATPase component